MVKEQPASRFSEEQGKRESREKKPVFRAN